MLLSGNVAGFKQEVHLLHFKTQLFVLLQQILKFEALFHLLEACISFSYIIYMNAGGSGNICDAAVESFLMVSLADSHVFLTRVLQGIIWYPPIPLRASLNNSNTKCAESLKGSWMALEVVPSL